MFQLVVVVHPLAPQTGDDRLAAMRSRTGNLSAGRPFRTKLTVAPLRDARHTHKLFLGGLGLIGARAIHIGLNSSILFPAGVVVNELSVLSGRC